MKHSKYIMLLLINLLTLAILHPARLSMGSSDSKDIVKHLDAGLVPNAVIDFNPQDRPAYIILVEKSSQRLALIEYNNGFKLKHLFSCSTGKNKGNKERFGDAKTPEGIYFLAAKLLDRDLSPTYGPLAFPTDYPNYLDRLEHRTGNSIWLHGTDKPLKPHNSNGCVAMENTNLEALSKYLELNRTPVIIEESIEWAPLNKAPKEKKEVLKFLEEWKSAFEQSKPKKYASLYANSNQTASNGWDILKKLNNDAKAKKESCSLKLKNLSLFRQRNAVIALFDEVVAFSDKSLKAGVKKLYLTSKSQDWKIIREEWQSPEKNGKDYRLLALQQLDIKTGKEKVEKTVVALVALKDKEKSNKKPIGEKEEKNTRDRDETKAIRIMIEGWRKSWEKKELEKYISYYDASFRAGTKNRQSWKENKGRLNKEYGRITVTVEDIKIPPVKGNTRTITFRQSYNAAPGDSLDGYSCKGIKQLILKKTKNDWKISFEAWQNLIKNNPPLGKKPNKKSK
ncbi:MAG: L,D-transpeptidase family protein [Pseudomonadota bacterium]